MRRGWADYIQDLRQRMRCRSYSQLARLLDLSPSTVSRWASGGSVSADEVIAVARKVGDEPVALLVLAGFLEPGETGRTSVAEERVRYLASVSESLSPEQWSALQTLIEGLRKR
jgi:transcriptional regulator with XRE-family HTH domain